jgi:hypothetical protein
MSHLSVTELIHLVERHGYALLFFWVLAEQHATDARDAFAVERCGVYSGDPRLVPEAAG